MNLEKFLPIGTVVVLKEAKKRIMITGYCCSSEKNPDVIFDYNGCMYPEGLLSSSQNLLFNHDQILKIYHLGYQDEESKDFRNKLKEFMDNLSK